MTTPATGTTAANALASLHKTLKSLIHPARPFLHSLSTPPLPPTRHTLQTALASLEKAALARESWDDANADKLLRVKHDAIVKKRAVENARESLRLCRAICERQDPFGGGGDIAWKVLKGIAEEVDAITDKNDADGGVQLSVCASKFFVDFEFVDLSKHQVNVTVKFRYLMDGEIPDENVSKSFEQLVRDAKFDHLKVAFKRLMDLEHLSDRCGSVLQHALRAFEDDLLVAQQVEKKDSLTPSEQRMLGHGLIARTALGLRIHFCDKYAATLGMEHAGRPMSITSGRSQLVMKEMTGPIPTFEFQIGDTTNVNACYVLRFENDITMCVSLAQTLDRLTGNPRKKEKEAKRVPSWPSLQKLLAISAFSAGSREHWSLESSEYQSKHARDGWCLNFVQSGNDLVPGVVVDRIPLCHVSQVKSVLNVLRQQLVFNQLFQSCFGGGKPGEGKDLRVESVVCDAPSFMQFSWFDANGQDMVCMGVRVLPGGAIEVIFSGTAMPCSNKKASAILNECKSLPLTITTILKMSTRTQ